MSQAQQRASFLPAYLLLGDEQIKVARTISKLEQRLVDAGGDLEFNREVYDASDGIDAAQLRSSLDTLPFGSPFRIVLVKGADTAGKEITEALVSYLAHPSPTTVVLITAHKLAKNTRLYKAIVAGGSQAIIACENRKGHDLNEWIASEAARLGKRITPGAVAALRELTGVSTLMLENDLAKLSLAAGTEAVIDESMVRRHVVRTTEIKPWDIGDAILARDAARALRNLELLPDKEIIGCLAYCVKEIHRLQMAQSPDVQASGLEKALGVQPFKVRAYRDGARKYSSRELNRALIDACACDEALKSQSDQRGPFIRWITGVCSASSQL